MITAYVDGSTNRNTKKSAIGIHIQGRNFKTIRLQKSIQYTKSHVSEKLAILYCILFLKRYNISNSQIVTDAEFLIKDKQNGSAFQDLFNNLKSNLNLKLRFRRKFESNWAHILANKMTR